MLKSVARMASGALIALAAASGPAKAALLQVEPVLLELNAPSAAGTLLLRNDEDFDVSVQIRVYRWIQNDGVERLEPTADAAASPPIVTLAPGSDYTIRVVRTAKGPVQGEESYRVLVDQLPDPRRQAKGAINMLIRQSIPVFFRARQTTSAEVSWTVRLDGNRLVIAGRNDGDERMRVASLRLRDSEGTTVSFGDGLAGYVLGRSAMNFIIPNPPRGFAHQGPIAIAVDSNSGPVHATAPPQSSP